MLQESRECARLPMSVNTCSPNSSTVRTFRFNFSNRGPRSSAAFICRVSVLFLAAVLRLSSSASIFVHASSICPSEILEMTSGDRLSSSTRGLNAFSTLCLFSNLLFSAVDRAWRDSISADTAARSLRKLARLISTELSTPSHAAIDRWRSSSFDLSFSPAI